MFKVSTELVEMTCELGFDLSKTLLSILSPPLISEKRASFLKKVQWMGRNLNPELSLASGKEPSLRR